MQEINLILGKLEEARIPYCIVGGLAAIAYGRPRLTLDADLVDDIRAMIDAGCLSDNKELLLWIERLGLAEEWKLVCTNR